MHKKSGRLLFVALMSFVLSGCAPLLELGAELGIDLETIESEFTETTSTIDPADSATEEPGVIEGEAYDTPLEVALYIENFDELPPNYLTKSEARDLGWVSSEGNLWDVAPGASIGGDYFGNFEGLLPAGDYTEADIEYDGGYRNSKRLVFSDDGSYYYTDDHYESFEEVKVGASE